MSDNLAGERDSSTKDASKSNRDKTELDSKLLDYFT